MHYYSHHIGDFDRATRHLTRIERSIYLDLLFLYYESEHALTLDMAALCRRIVARSEDERAAVLAVLGEFFHETPTGWFHDRCEEELEAYRKSASQKSAAGKASAQARADRRAAAMQRPFNDRSTTVEQALNERGTDEQRQGNGESTNQEPRTINQKPVTKDMSPQSADAIEPEKVERRKTRRFTPEDEACARWLFGCNLSVNPEAKQPNWNTWSDEVRLMREQDKRTHRAICELYAWAKKDGFWSPNIQSPGKLREKWDQLTEQRMRKGGDVPGAPLNRQEQLEANNRAVVERMLAKGGTP